jgi:butyryl-CoA dehydrogenase
MDFELNEEQKMLKRMARTLSEKEFKPRAAEWDESGEIPLENFKSLAKLGLLGVTIPVEYGGGGKSLFEYVLVLEEVARCCANTAMTMAGGTDGAGTRAIVNFGTEAQKEKYLCPVPKGEKFIAWGMTEPEAGSDIVSLTTSAYLNNETYIVNGVKRFCTMGSIAHTFVVFARFEGVKGAKGIGGIIVERGMPGFSNGKVEHKMGLRGSGTADLIFEDCRVPKANVLVPPGEFRKLMASIGTDRGGSNPAICLGIAQGAFEEALAYSQERKQFGKTISEFQGIQWILADMAIKIEAARLLIYKASFNAGKGFSTPLESSIAKAYANEMAVEVTNSAMQILGGYGYMKEYKLERMFRDARGWSFAGGTPQIQRNIIASALLKRESGK